MSAPAAVVAALALLAAGCSAPADPAPTPAPTTAAPRLVVLFQNASYDSYTGPGGSGPALDGERAAPWDAGQALGLPQPFVALLVEMQCTGGAGFGDQENPGLHVTLTYDNGTGNPFEANGGADDADCTTLRYDLSAGSPEAPGRLKSLVVDAPFNGATVDADIEIEYAVTLFIDAAIPEGYTAFG